MGKQQQQQQQQQNNKRRRGGSKNHAPRSNHAGGGGGSNNNNKTMILSKRDRRLQEISMLQQRIDDETPPRGTLPHLTTTSTTASTATAVISFRSLPISQATLQGLENPLPLRANSGQTSYTTMTEIQHASLPHSLAGRDILGAARTGSGKTLAFCIPVLECLYRHGIVSGSDGPSAIILSPTRELAVQISQVFQQVGRFHTGIQMGCLIGGAGGSSKSKHDAFVKEQQHIATTNIIIATPGRLLQHLQETSQLQDVSQPGQVKILVLDEADRILDLGFRNQLIQILEYLPDPNNHNHNNTADDDDADIDVHRRQTLLFSATQTRHVKDLATLSLHRPEYIRVHDFKSSNSSNRKNRDDDDDENDMETNHGDEDAAIMTPERLQQSYIVVPLKDKLNAIYSFIKSHLHCKSIIFLTSCSQVRHAHLLFCALRPGVPILCLHGKLLQSKRTEIYQQFQRSSSQQQRHNGGGGSGSGGGSGGVVLFSTDVCARGLDFPNVDWVVQMDAPEDRDMYIHRAGRTARYKSHGKALLMITPQEEKNGFVTNILQSQSSSSSSSSPASLSHNKTKKRQLPLQKLAINPTKTMLVTQRAAALVASNIKLHQLAKKAFSSYLKSVMLMPHKQVFKLEDYQVPIQRRSSDSNNNNNNIMTTTTDLDDFALSLGLAATPRLDFITKYNNKAIMSRDECRSAKNVNRKLQKLKEQIKAEKLAKKQQKQGQQDDSKDSKNKAVADDDNGSDDDELLVSKSKQRHDNIDNSGDDNDDNDSTDLPDPGLDQVTRSRKAKRIRIDARGSGENKRIVFDDNADGTLQPAKESLQDFVSDHNIMNGDNDEETLQRATEEYMQQVHNRLHSNQKLDREQERDRIRQKHRKRRLQDRGGDRDDDDNVDNNDGGGGSGTAVTLLSSEDYAAAAAGRNVNNKSHNDDESSTSSSSSDDESSTTSSSSSSSSTSIEEDDNEAKIKAQEELALSFIRGKK